MKKSNTYEQKHAWKVIDFLLGFFGLWLIPYISYLIAFSYVNDKVASYVSVSLLILYIGLAIFLSFNRGRYFLAVGMAAQLALMATLLIIVGSCMFILNR